MRDEPGELLRAGLHSLGIEKADLASTKLLDFSRLVLAENRRTNLTGARDLLSLIREHVLDSLAPLGLVDVLSPVVDIGSGGGFPGIPAAIVHPREEFILLEPRAKRAAFLERAASELKLPNVRVIKSSVRGPGASSLVGFAGTVLIRAVAEPREGLLMGLQLLRPGGSLLLYEGRSSTPTRAERNAASRSRGGPIEVRRVHVPGLHAVRHAWIVRKQPQD